MADAGTFAVALDGNKNQVRSITSNPGHCLWSRIVDADKAPRVVRSLLSEDLSSGWGVRTLSRSNPAYDPIGYHTGSIWPHDNAIAAAGFARYGLTAAVTTLASAMFDSSQFFDRYRMPELFCGFHRRPGDGPTLYPVACSPQAWAAGAPFLLLQAMLGLSARANENLLTVNKPLLPPWLNEVELRNLTREAETNRELLLTFLTRFREITQQRDLQQADARVLSPADTPRNPAYPRTAAFFGVSFGASLMLGVLLVFLIERWSSDYGFRSADEIQSIAGLRALALVPDLTRRDAQGIPAEEYVLQKPNSAFSEALQRVRTNLFLVNGDRPPKSVLITSSVPLTAGSPSAATPSIPQISAASARRGRP